MNREMKNWMGAAALVVSSSLLTGAVMHAGSSMRGPGMETAAPVVPSGMVDLTEAATHAVGSVVYIKVTVAGKTQKVTVQSPFDDFFGDFFGFGGRGGQQPQQREYKSPDQHAAGSGVIISADGYIVTNNHVVGQADEISVKLNDNREFKARIIGTDETTDLALIKIDAKDLPAIAIGNSDDLKLGQWVLAVGNPFNLTSTVTAGIISAKARTLGANSVESFIQTDAAINSGNSGGALVNERGELVGINSMLYSQTGSYSGYGFAIPTTIMNRVVDDLKVYGTVQRAILGVEGQDAINYIDREKEKGNTPDLGTNNGIYITNISDGTAAEEAGLEKGDVITKFDGKEVGKMSQLQEQIAQKRPGDAVSITILRDKKERTLKATLRNQQGGTKVLKEIDPDQLGVSMKELTDGDRQNLGLTYGITVAAIKNGKMKAAGVTKGTIILYVNDKKMQTPDDWQEAIAEANKTADRTLWIKAMTQSGLKRSFVIELGE